MRVAGGPDAGPSANLGNWFAGSHRYIKCSMAMGISIREFARRDGCSDMLVRKAIKAGRLPALADGTLDPLLVGSGWRKANRRGQPKVPPAPADLQEIAHQAVASKGGRPTRWSRPNASRRIIWRCCASFSTTARAARWRPLMRSRRPWRPNMQSFAANFSASG